jgi:hypothetical protein
MGVYIKDGTPLETASLCETCTHACITRGYRENELVVVCQATYPEREIAFRVRECTRHIDKISYTLSGMEKIAWLLNNKGTNRKVGFVRPGEADPDESKFELILNKNK